MDNSKLLLKASEEVKQVRWIWEDILEFAYKGTIARRSNQSILKEISPECSLEGLMLILKLQYFGDLMRRTDSFEKSLIWKDWGWEEMGTTLQSWERRVRPSLVWRNGTPHASLVLQGNLICLPWADISITSDMQMTPPLWQKGKNN